MGRKVPPLKELVKIGKTMGKLTCVWIAYEYSVHPITAKQIFNAIKKLCEDGALDDEKVICVPREDEITFKQR